MYIQILDEIIYIFLSLPCLTLLPYEIYSHEKMVMLHAAVN